jgi:hypothetical protein
VSPKLDPAFAKVWRTPDEVQFGALDPCVVLDRPERMPLDLIHLLSRGASVDSLTGLAGTHGGEREDVLALLETLTPVLLDAPPPRAPRKRPGPVIVSGDDGAARAIVGGLRLLGHDVVRVPTGEPLSPRVPGRMMVLVEPRVIAPPMHLALLRRDLPHLPLVTGDGRFMIGPLVVPGITPCLRCLDLARRDADPAWPAIASQLTAHPAPPPEPRLEFEAQSIAVPVVDRFLSGTRLSLVGAVQMIARDGLQPGRGRQSLSFHPECGCRSLEGTETLPGLPEDPRPVEPSSASDDAWPE